MNIKLTLKRYWWNFVRSFGLIWLFIEPATNFVEILKGLGNEVYYIIVLTSLFVSIFLTKQKKILERYISGGNSKISIYVGDLFEQQSHIIIGTNDVFDTELGNVIKPNSVQGQFTQKNEVATLNRTDNLRYLKPN